MIVSRYYAITKQWEKEYGVTKSRAFNYDITEARLCCRRCGKLKKKMSRHHTGNDFFFAQMMPEHFAARYIQFRKEDTAKLCDDCHKLAHRMMKRYVAEIWDELHEHGQKIITKEWCEAWMAKLRKEFEKWVVKPPKKRKRKHKNKNKKSHSTTKREV